MPQHDLRAGRDRGAAVAAGQAVLREARGEERGRQHDLARRRSRIGHLRGAAIDGDGRHRERERAAAVEALRMDGAAQHHVGVILAAQGRVDVERCPTERRGSQNGHIGGQRNTAALPHRQTVGAELELAVGPDIAAARHIDHAAGRQHDALGRIDEEPVVAPRSAGRDRGDAHRAAVDEGGAMHVPGGQAGIVDPEAAHIEHPVGTDDHRRGRREYRALSPVAIHEAREVDLARGRVEHAVDGRDAVQGDAAARTHRKGRSLGHAERVGTGDRDRAERGR